MSGYEKSHPSDLIGLDNARHFQNSSGYGTFSQTPYISQLPFPSNPQSESSDGEQLRYVTDADYLPQAPYGNGRSSVTHPMPTIMSYSPRVGLQGFRVYVCIETPYDLLSSPSPSFALGFASKRSQCVLEPLEPRGPHYQYVLSAQVPSFASTAWHSLSVPLRLFMEADGQNPQSSDLGVFAYDEHPANSPSQSSRKRKASDAPEDPVARPTKRPSSQNLSIKQDPDTFIYGQAISTSPYSPFLPTPTSANVYSGIKPSQVASPNSIARQPSAMSSQPQSLMRVPSPRTPSWSPSFATVNRPTRSPGLANTATQQSAAPSPSGTANPPLIRTSTIQHSPSSSSTTGMPSQTGQPFNPYAMYPHKAVLRLNGNLDSMVEGWSPEEWEKKRRLVQFSRRQNGSTIRADFKPVSPEERPPNSICISCIYWEEKNECFVTSVDTIYLLESLVAVRFTVEEKNRIRRNLEGFRPLTVSKAKSDSEDFFKVIMGFPNPKPRNIEKDVKVFPWKILSHALKKIIGKYSASYSSTAGALLTPVSSTYPSAGGSETGTDPHPVLSPRSVSDTTSTSTYAASLTSTTSPAMPDTTLLPDLRVTVPQMGNPYSAIPTTYGYQPMMQQGMPISQPPMSAPLHRGSWDYGSLMNAGPGTGIPASAQPSYYVPAVPYSTNQPTSGA